VGPAVRVPPGATGGGEGVGPEVRPEGAVPREAERHGWGVDFDQPRGNYRLVSAIFYSS